MIALSKGSDAGAWPEIQFRRKQGSHDFSSLNYHKRPAFQHSLHNAKTIQQTSLTVHMIRCACDKDSFPSRGMSSTAVCCTTIMGTPATRRLC